jgi:hypothetical protein
MVGFLRNNLLQLIVNGSVMVGNEVVLMAAPSAKLFMVMSKAPAVNGSPVGSGTGINSLWNLVRWPYESSGLIFIFNKNSYYLI